MTEELHELLVVGGFEVVARLGAAGGNGDGYPFGVEVPHQPLCSWGGGARISTTVRVCWDLLKLLICIIMTRIN